MEESEFKAFFKDNTDMNYPLEIENAILKKVEAYQKKQVRKNKILSYVFQLIAMILFPVLMFSFFEFSYLKLSLSILSLGLLLLQLDNLISDYKTKNLESV